MNTKPSEPVRLQPGQDYRIRLSVTMNNPGLFSPALIFCSHVYVTAPSHAPICDCPRRMLFLKR